MDYNFNNENEPWELSLDIDDFDLQLTHIVRSSNSIHVEPSPLTQNSVTIIPGPSGIVILGPAGLVQRAKLLKENVFILDPDGALRLTQEYMQKVVEGVGEDSDFNGGAWVNATNYVIAFGGTVTECTVPGTIHYKVLDVGSYGKDITVGAAMILANVSVFTPKPSEHYLNITKQNVVEPRQNYYGCKFFLWKEERVGLLINSPGGSFSTTTFSQATSTSPSFSPTPFTTPIYYGGSSTNTECSNCKHLLGRIKVLQATLEMHRHSEQHTLNSAALLHDLMEKLGLE
nr:hypothetical protein [Tanacetum cinerariifolium]